MRFGAAHTPRRNMVKPIIAAMRESVKYISCIFFAHFFSLVITVPQMFGWSEAKQNWAWWSSGKGGCTFGRRTRVRFPMGAARGAAAYA